VYLLLSLGILTLVTACSDDGDNGQATPAVLRNWIPGEYHSSANYRDYCAIPRSGNDPFSNQPVPDRQGRTEDENNWLRAIHREFYLWYNEIPDIYDPVDYLTPDFFELQRTAELSTTGSGREKDIFHFAVNTQEFFDTIVMGVNAGYGAEFKILADLPPREVAVAYTEPNSPATAAMLARGARVISVDGELVEDGNLAVISAGLFPTAVGESHTFVVRDLGAASDRTIDLTSAEVTSTPVQNAGVVPGSANVGYMLFNDHIATAEAQLIDAINVLQGLGVTDLILDLRYNGGGFLDIASELAYMIGGNATTDLVFERLEFNDQYSNVNFNPITGENLETPFHSTVLGFSNGVTQGDPLPTLNANNVVVITSEDTCSASEAIMNGLRATSVNVMQVGTTTCGKPYGTTPLDNCGVTYLFTQFQGFNENDEGGFSDGFKPANAGGFGVDISGCAVADDLDNAFDENEANIAVALDILANPTSFTCPAPPPMTKLSAGANNGDNKIANPQPEQKLEKPRERQFKIVF